MGKEMENKIRFLLSRDDYYHQRGYWVVAKALSNAGIEVVLGGIQTPNEIIRTAIDEDVDVVGYRIMNAAPFIVVSKLFERMKEHAVQNVPVVIGGIIPKKDESLIRELGVREVFHPYTPLEQVISKIKLLATDAHQQ